MDELTESYGDFYGELLNKVSTHLSNNNIKYRKNVDRCIEITEKYPNVRQVCEEKEPVALTFEEVKALIEYKECDLNRDIMEGKKLVFEGAKICYYLLESAEMIKENNML